MNSRQPFLGFPKKDAFSRRTFLRDSSCGFGLMGLAGMLAQSLGAASISNPLAVREPHFKPRAKRIIFLFMHGGPSHVDTFDPKPRLIRDHGKPIPFERGLTFAEDDQIGGLMKSPWEFKQYGESGIPVSSLFPHTAQVVDDLCLVRSMVGDGVDHGAALLQLHTGSFSMTRPSIGSWVVYGLGTENQNLPGFITIKPTLAHGGGKNWSAAFLPGVYQGTSIGHAGLKVADIENEPIEHLLQKTLKADEQRFELDMLQKLNRRHQERRQQDPALEARIEAFELAFRMQVEAPEAFEVERESEETKKLYGLDDPVTRDFGWQCLLARRLAERNVRFIQCTHSYKWDQHSQLYDKHTENAAEVDKPIAGLITDLKARGMLEDTLVLWSGEFGRTPFSQGKDGRDHNPYGYTCWLAGAGVKKGFIYGATDDFGYHATEDRMHIHDLHATILHLLGIDHEKLTYRYAGRDFRLTDVHGIVAKNILL